uniref:Cysteine rich protein 1 n=1 Tax=Bos indicus x Bos taurus TaxID=30522 RepID=A0A4W2FNZ5_BOBOX
MPKCPKCSKEVYFAERVTSLGKDWHRPCLKCEKCGKTLTSGGHAEHEGKPYCNHPCYAAMFGPKGMLPTTLPDPALHSPWPPLTCPLPLCRLWARRSREPHFQVNPGTSRRLTPPRPVALRAPWTCTHLCPCVSAQVLETHLQLPAGLLSSRPMAGLSPQAPGAPLIDPPCPQ